MIIDVYKVPEGQKRAGFYTFRIDGKESLLYCSTEQGIWQKINLLLHGSPGGSVTLPTVNYSAATMNEKPKQLSLDQIFSLPTKEERLEAFFGRGKLGEHDNQDE